MNLLTAAAGTVGWLGTGELVRRRLERDTGTPRGPLTIACWPVAVLAEAALVAAVWALGRAPAGEDHAASAPLGWRALKDDGGWLHPEEARLLSRAECERAGHVEVDVRSHGSDVPVRRVCARCGSEVTELPVPRTP